MANNQDKAQEGVLSDVAKLSTEPKRDQSFDEMIEAVPMDAAIVKAENDSLATMARLHPRDETVVLTAMLEELEAVPSLITGEVNKYYYRIKNRGKGLTVRAAETIARRWRNNMTTVQVSMTTEGAIATGVFIDLETNVRSNIPKTVSRYSRRRICDEKGNFTGKYRMKRLAPDEFALEIDKQAAKAYRNAVLRSIPPYIILAVIAKIEEIEGAKFKEPGSVEKMLALFLEVGVTRETIEQHLGHPIKSTNKDEFVEMRAIYSGIAGGETSAKKAFALEEEKPERPSGPVGKEAFTPKGEEIEFVSVEGAKKTLVGSGTHRGYEETLLLEFLVDAIGAIIRDNKGITAIKIKAALKEKHGQEVTEKLIASVLERMIEEGEIAEGKEAFMPEKEEKKDAKKDADKLAEEVTLRDVLLKIVQENKGLTVNQVQARIAKEHNRNVTETAIRSLLKRMHDDGDIDRSTKDSILVYGPMK